MNLLLLIAGFLLLMIFTVFAARLTRSVSPRIIPPLPTPFKLEFVLNARDRFAVFRYEQLWKRNYLVGLAFLALVLILRSFTTVVGPNAWLLTFGWLLLLAVALTPLIRVVLWRGHRLLPERMSLRFVGADPEGLERLDEPRVLRFELLREYVVIVLWNRERVIVPRQFTRDAGIEAGFLALLRQSPMLEWQRETLSSPETLSVNA